MLRISAFLLCTLTLTAPAFAQTPDTVFLEDLTWTEVQQRVRSGKTTIIIPIGGTEQNGPHMTLGKHNVRARALSGKIATALGDALVAPVVAYVPEGQVEPPTSHMRFAGTVTVPPETFEQVLEYAARSFRQHGFRNIVFLGDHGGYQAGIKAVAARLNREWAATPARALAVAEYYRASQGTYAQALRERGYRTGEIGSHAGLADTSLMLALDPRQVRAELLRHTRFKSADGVYGDPQRASAEIGQLGVDAIVTQTVAAIRKGADRR